MNERLDRFTKLLKEIFELDSMRSVMIKALLIRMKC